jgi:hypothetical protein
MADLKSQLIAKTRACELADEKRDAIERRLATMDAKAADRETKYLDLVATSTTTNERLTSEVTRVSSLVNGVTTTIAKGDDVQNVELKIINGLINDLSKVCVSHSKSFTEYQQIDFATLFNDIKANERQRSIDNASLSSLVRTSTDNIDSMTRSLGDMKATSRNDIKTITTSLDTIANDGRSLVKRMDDDARSLRTTLTELRSSLLSPEWITRVSTRVDAILDEIRTSPHVRHLTEIVHWLQAETEGMRRQLSEQSQLIDGKDIDSLMAARRTISDLEAKLRDLDAAASRMRSERKEAHDECGALRKQLHDRVESSNKRDTDNLRLLGERDNQISGLTERLTGKIESLNDCQSRLSASEIREEKINAFVLELRARIDELKLKQALLDQSAALQQAEQAEREAKLTSSLVAQVAELKAQVGAKT